MMFHGDPQGGTDASDGSGVYMTSRHLASQAVQIIENARLFGRAAVQIQ